MILVPFRGFLLPYLCSFPDGQMLSQALKVNHFVVISLVFICGDLVLPKASRTNGVESPGGDEKKYLSI